MTADQVRALVLAAVYAISAATGWFVTRLYYKAEISRMETTYAKEQQAVAEENTKALASAQARSDAAVLKAAESDRARMAISQETQHEINRLTTGSACLSADVVRLLNAGPVRDGQRPSVQGTAAADAGPATDSDIATWIDTAKLYYGRCQDRVDALIHFFDGGGDAAE